MHFQGLIANIAFKPQNAICMKIRLGIVDTHPVICKGIAAMLSPHVQIETVFMLNDLRELSSAMSREAVDVLLLDLQMSDQNVSGLCRQLRGISRNAVSWACRRRRRPYRSNR